MQAEVTYSSLAAMVADAENLPARPGAMGRTHASRTQAPGHRWDDGAGWEGTLKLARYGWHEGVARIVDLSDRIAEQVSKQLPTYGMELMESGGDVDVAAYLNGQRECMWDWTESGSKMPVVRITVNAALSGGTSAQATIVAGALIAALADALEQVGRRVEVDVYDTARGSGAEYNVGARIKDASDPLDRASLVYAVAHPSFCRRLGFAIGERLPVKLQNSIGGGYGRVGHVPTELQGDVHVDLVTAAQLGIEGAYGWIIDKLRSLGIEVAGD